jgi:hypothetical protein
LGSEVECQFIGNIAQGTGVFHTHPKKNGDDICDLQVCLISQYSMSPLRVFSA